MRYSIVVRAVQQEEPRPLSGAMVYASRALELTTRKQTYIRKQKMEVIGMYSQVVREYRTHEPFPLADRNI